MLQICENFKISVCEYGGVTLYLPLQVHSSTSQKAGYILLVCLGISVELLFIHMCKHKTRISVIQLFSVDISHQVQVDMQNINNVQEMPQAQGLWSA